MVGGVVTGQTKNVIAALTSECRMKNEVLESLYVLLSTTCNAAIAMVKAGSIVYVSSRSGLSITPPRTPQKKTKYKEHTSGPA